MIVLFALLAVLVTRELQAAWIGAFCGYLFGRQQSLSDEIERLRRALELLQRQRMAPPSTTDTAADAAPPVDETVPPAEPAAPLPRVIVPPPRVIAQPAAIPPATASSASGWSTAPASRSAIGDHITAWFQRGNPFARLGVLVTFIGAIFLIKYAAQQGYFPIAWRLAGLAAGALAMVGMGLRLRARSESYALTLQGGGLALVYLVILAAHRYYGVLPNGWALPLLILASVASAVLALRQNALALAVIGFAGGFVAPLAVGGSGGPVPLFTYYAVLNLALFAIVYFRDWPRLSLLGFVFTFVITALWRALAYRTEWFPATEFFLGLFWLLYVGFGLLSGRRQGTRGVVSGTLIFGLPAVVLSLQQTLVVGRGDALAWSAVVLGVFYLALAGAVSRWMKGARLLIEAYLAVAVVALSIAVPLALDHDGTAAVWALEGAGAVWLGVRQQRWLARAFGIGIQLLAGVGLMFAAFDLDAAAGAALAPTVLAAALLAAAGIVSAVWLHRAEAARDWERHWDAAALLWGGAWALYAGVEQIEFLNLGAEVGAKLAVGAAVAVGLSRIGAWLSWRCAVQLAFAALVLFSLQATPVAIYTHPFASGGVWGWALWLAAQFGLLALVARRPELAPRAEPLLHGLGVVALIAVLTGELYWRLRVFPGGDWPPLALLLVPASAQLALALRQPRWPVQAREALYATIFGAGLSVWLMVVVVALALGNRGSAAPLLTLPVLNPLDASIAAAFIAIAAWWLSLEDLQQDALQPESAWPIPATTAAVLLIWLSSTLVRAMHLIAGTPLSITGMLDSALLQAALSIFWGLLGLCSMLVGARRHWRGAWVAGAVLMAIVALKLFLIDTAGTGTLARIAAFMIVGVLLLITGYVAPLPPAPDTEASDEKA